MPLPTVGATVSAQTRPGFVSVPNGEGFKWVPVVVASASASSASSTTVDSMRLQQLEVRAGEVQATVGDFGTRLTTAEGRVSLTMDQIATNDDLHDTTRLRQDEHLAQFESTFESITGLYNNLAANRLAPAGPNNTSRRVWEEVDGVVYEAWARLGSSAEDLEVLLSDVDNAPAIFSLVGAGLPRPYKSSMAHLYVDFEHVYVQDSTQRVYYHLLPSASLVQKQTNPSSQNQDVSKWDLTQTVN